MKKKIILNYPKSAAIGFCCKGLKNEFETAVVVVVVVVLLFYVHGKHLRSCRDGQLT